MQLHAALLHQKLAVQREIERAAQEEDQLQRAIEEAEGVASTGRSGDDDGDGVEGGHGRSRDRRGDGRSGLGDEDGEGGGARGAPTPRRSRVALVGEEGGIPGKSSLTESSGHVSTRRVDRLHVWLRARPFWLDPFRPS